MDIPENRNSFLIGTSLALIGTPILGSIPLFSDFKLSVQNRAYHILGMMVASLICMSEFTSLLAGIPGFDPAQMCGASCGFNLTIIMPFAGAFYLTGLLLLGRGLRMLKNPEVFATDAEVSAPFWGALSLTGFGNYFCASLPILSITTLSQSVKFRCYYTRGIGVGLLIQGTVIIAGTTALTIVTNQGCYTNCVFLESLNMTTPADCNEECLSGQAGSLPVSIPIGIIFYVMGIAFIWRSVVVLKKLANGTLPVFEAAEVVRSSAKVGVDISK
ncbi:hypothetical protein HDU98_006944 [Podochytrium sp. JEL0797]|nr:hypothetical protein HDU98_006939 [Podochytrium sp. JEL0797]KAJ3070013.1 hypothetical protein HDU98_006944 [Podochytrium sp. JEL0797]